ncbi:MAG: hypothetical protein ACRC28_18660 [Clostridium sp.]|uniref:hypothetical protein n=1 Tax=Clostridium sp. TaxID=1506 RepID=UPI003F2F0DED
MKVELSKKELEILSNLLVDMDELTLTSLGYKGTRLMVVEDVLDKLYKSIVIERTKKK